MVRKVKIGVLVSASIVGLAAYSPAALAQEGDEEATSSTGLGEIIVTAQRREERLQDVPVAVSAFDDAAIERLNSRDISDLTGQVPNLVLSEVAIGPGLAQISIRGVNTQDPEKSFDPAVGVFIDGIYLGTSAFNLLDTFDLERIEVLRGPQGTLFGRNTTGGAINAFRRRPTGELGFRGQVTIGNYGRNDYKAEINLPAFGEVASVLVRGQYLNDNGFFDNPAGGGTGAKDKYSIGAALRLYQPGVADVLITYDHAEDNSQLAPYFPRGISTIDPLPFTITDEAPPVPATIVPAFGPDLLCLRANRCNSPDAPVTTVSEDHFLDATLDAMTINADFFVSDYLTVTAIAGIRDSSEAVYIDFDGTNLTVFDVVRFQNFSQYSGELRFASSFDGPLNFVAGLFHFHSEYDLRQAIKLDLAMVGAPVPVGALYINGNGDEDDFTTRTSAIFAQADYDITEALTLTLGGRITWDRKRIFTQFKGSPLGPTADYQITDGIPDNRPITSSGGASVSFSQFTPKVMLSYEPQDDALLYVSYSRGYNAGGFSGRAGTVADVTTPYDPEYIDAFELGAKLDLLERRLRFNVAAFWNDYGDKQEETIQPGPPPSFTSTTVRNASTARIRGVELEVSALPVPQLRLDASFGYLDATYTNFDTFVGSGQYQSTPAQPAGTLLTADLSSLELRRAPEFSGSLGATFTTELSFGRLILNGDARYVDDQFADFFNSERGRIPSYIKLDASASIEFGGPRHDLFRVTVFGENLTDKQFYSGFTNSLVDFSTRSAPRLYGVELGIDF